MDGCKEALRVRFRGKGPWLVWEESVCCLLVLDSVNLYTAVDTPKEYCIETSNGSYSYELRITYRNLAANFTF